MMEPDSEVQAQVAALREYVQTPPQAQPLASGAASTTAGPARTASPSRRSSLGTPLMKRKLEQLAANKGSDTTPLSQARKPSIAGDSAARPAKGTPQHPPSPHKITKTLTIGRKQQIPRPLGLTVAEVSAWMRNQLRQLSEDHSQEMKRLFVDMQKTMNAAATSRDASAGGSDAAADVEPSFRIAPLQGVETVSPIANLEKREAKATGKKLTVFYEAPDNATVANAPQVPTTLYRSTEPIVPRYRAFTSVKRNILCENDNVLRYNPFFGDEEDPEDIGLLQEYFDDQVRYLPAKHRHKEQALRLLPVVHRMISNYNLSVQEVIGTMLEKGSEPMVETGQLLASEYSISPDDLQTPARESALVAKLAPTALEKGTAASLMAEATSSITKLSLWSVLKVDPQVKTILKTAVSDILNINERGADNGKPVDLRELRCCVCFVYNCPEHGEYDERNKRKYVIACNRPTVANGSSQANGNKDGVENQGSTAEAQPCSDECFLKSENGNTVASEWTPAEIQLLKSTLPAWRRCKTAACSYTLVLSKPCREIHAKIRELEPPTPDGMPDRGTALLSDAAGNGVNGGTGGTNGGGRRTNGGGCYINWTETKTHRLDKRTPFEPCSHAGPCTKNAGCSCFDQEVACEKFCHCGDACRRRFQGCSCARKGWPCQTERCECYVLNRECDADLCHSCGASQLLDPANHRDPALAAEQRCGNVNLQLGIPKRTLVGTSEVEGYGLFMGEDVGAKEYLGEYVAELISSAESERRGAIYNLRKSSYLFELNKRQVLDATRIGNKFRFANHSHSASNCAPKVLFVNGVQRIAMFSTQSIRAGDELFFDYGPEYHSSLLSKEPKR